MTAVSIVDAAIRYPTGEIYRGSRHADCIKEAALSGLHERTDTFEQGFIAFHLKSGGWHDSFVTREEALPIAISARQISQDHTGQLYSEDLWPFICPRCHGHSGFFVKWVEVRTYYFGFDFEGQGEADDPTVVSGGRRYCQDCRANITKFIKE